MSVELPQPAADGRPYERLTACDKFILDRWRLTEPQTLGGDHRCHLLAVLQGEVKVPGDPAGRPLATGDVMLVPASCGRFELRPAGSAILLDAYLPE